MVPPVFRYIAPQIKLFSVTLSLLYISALYLELAVRLLDEAVLNFAFSVEENCTVNLNLIYREQLWLCVIFFIVPTIRSSYFGVSPQVYIYSVFVSVYYKSVWTPH